MTVDPVNRRELMVSVSSLLTLPAPNPSATTRATNASTSASTTPSTTLPSRRQALRRGRVGGVGSGGSGRSQAKGAVPSGSQDGGVVRGGVNPSAGVSVPRSTPR